MKSDSHYVLEALHVRLGRPRGSVPAAGPVGRGGVMRCPPCNRQCNQGRTCPAVWQHNGAAVVDSGIGLHMPLDEETHDLPVTMFEPDEPLVTAGGVLDWIDTYKVPALICALAFALFALGGLLAGIYVACGRLSL